MSDIKVISVGGSIIAPDRPDSEFLSEFVQLIISWLNADESRRLILVAGGGGPARAYQSAYREIMSHQDPLATTTAASTTESAAADWIGIMATRLNAELVRACFGALAPEPVVINPYEAPEKWHGRILVAAGWKPGFSSDNDAVLLAEKYGADTVINLSNIEKVYDSDPKENPDAKPLEHIYWSDFRKMVGDTWEPGKNTPFDPIASKKAEELSLVVICADGHNIDNTRLILDGGDFVGTSITS